MSISNYVRRHQAKFLSVFFAMLAVSLVTGACRRQVVKYGGPPAEVRERIDSLKQADAKTAQATTEDKD